MLKATLGSLMALTLLVSVGGCDRKSQPIADTASPGAPAGAMPASQPHPAPGASSASVDLAGIAKATGGKTVAEVFAMKDQLAGQQVVFRGKVVKSNPGIMGKNWIHVRDGSGTAGSNDLTVTTASAQPNVGDTVLVTGPVALNKDFGMGYQYDVIVEDADVKIEAAAVL